MGLLLVPPAWAASFIPSALSDSDLYRLLALGGVVFIAAMIVRYMVLRAHRSDQPRAYGLRTTSIRSREP